MNGESFPVGLFAGKLRKNLFREHLGLLEHAGSNIDINDPISDAFYKHTWQKIAKENTKIFDEVFKCIPNDSVRTIHSLKKYSEEPPMWRVNVRNAEERLKHVQGSLVELPLNFLCEENLLPSNATKEGE